MIEQKAADYAGFKCLVAVDVKADKTFQVHVLRQQTSTLLLKRFPGRTTTSTEFLEFVRQVPQDVLREPLLHLLAFGRQPGSPLERCFRGTARSLGLKIL